MKKSLLKFIVSILLIISSLNLSAQTPGTENTSGTGNLENPDVPINDFLIPMLVVGIIISFYLINKKPASIKK